MYPTSVASRNPAQATHPAPATHPAQATPSPAASVSRSIQLRRALLLTSLIMLAGPSTEADGLPASENSRAELPPLPRNRQPPLRSNSSVCCAESGDPGCRTSHTAATSASSSMSLPSTTNPPPPSHNPTRPPDRP